MTSRDFCYWLQGFFEIGLNHTPPSIRSLTPSQVEMIEKHLRLVFKHEIDPSMGDAKHQTELNKIHSFKIPQTEEEAIAAWGPKPGPQYTFNLHGWYDPAEGQPRC